MIIVRVMYREVIDPTTEAGGLGGAISAGSRVAVGKPPDRKAL